MQLRFVLVLFVISALVVPVQAYEKTVMVEHFSNYGCGPCARNYDQVEDFFAQYSRDEAVLITYHEWWPLVNDWYYLINPDPAERFDYYEDLMGIPTFMVDGLYTHIRMIDAMNSIDDLIGEYTRLEIIVDTATVHMDGTINTQVTLNTDLSLSGYSLRAVLIDKDCAYGKAPNTIENYHWNVLQMVPDIIGIDLSDIPANGTETFDFTFNLWPDHRADNIALVFFAQNRGFQNVAQATYSDDFDILFPGVSIVDYEFDDYGQSKPNGQPDPGECVDLILNLENGEEFLSTDNLVGTLSCSNDQITISQATATWDDISPGAMARNTPEPFEIMIPANFAPEYVTFSVHFVDGCGYESDCEFLQLVGQPTIALIDDSRPEEDLFDDLFTMMLESGITMEMLTSSQAVAMDLTQYAALVWITSNATSYPLSTTERETIATYLGKGGKLLLSGENIGEDSSTEDLLATYFKAEHELDNVGDSFDLLYGVSSGPFPEAVIYITCDGMGTTRDQASVTPLAEGTSLFRYNLIGNIGGVGYNGDIWSAIYLPFNIESVSGIYDSWRSADVLWNCMHWMGATTAVDAKPIEQVVLPQTVELSGYPNPFNTAMTISYTLPTAAEVELTVVNLLGQTVAELSRGQVAAGVHEVTWDASVLSSGVYFLSLRAGDVRRMDKVVLLK